MINYCNTATNCQHNTISRWGSDLRAYLPRCVPTCNANRRADSIIKSRLLPYRVLQLKRTVLNNRMLIYVYTVSFRPADICLLIFLNNAEDYVTWIIKFPCNFRRMRRAANRSCVGLVARQTAHLNAIYRVPFNVTTITYTYKWGTALLYCNYAYVSDYSEIVVNITYVRFLSLVSPFSFLLLVINLLIDLTWTTDKDFFSLTMSVDNLYRSAWVMYCKYILTWCISNNVVKILHKLSLGYAIKLFSSIELHWYVVLISEILDRCNCEVKNTKTRFTRLRTMVENRQGFCC